jgi:hypothetical protein
MITVTSVPLRTQVICGLCDKSASGVLLIDSDRFMTTCPDHVDVAVQLAQEHLIRMFRCGSEDVAVDEDARSYPAWKTRGTIDNL